MVEKSEDILSAVGQNCTVILSGNEIVVLKTNGSLDREFPISDLASVAYKQAGTVLFGELTFRSRYWTSPLIVQFDQYQQPEFAKIMKRINVFMGNPSVVLPGEVVAVEEEEDEPSTAEMVLDTYVTLLTAMWPLIVRHLRSKQESGETIGVMDIAARVGIPSAVVPLLMPVLQEKLEEFLGDNGINIFR